MSGDIIVNMNLSLRKTLTLAELMIAAAVLMLTCSMVYLLFANCIILNQFNRERTIAISHAEYVLEEIKNESFTNLEDRINGVSPFTAVWDWNTSDIATKFDPSSASDFVPLLNEAIDTGEIGTNASLLDIQVTVSWDDRGGTNRSISLRTLTAEP
jgi:hypothetical protein